MRGRVVLLMTGVLMGAGAGPAAAATLQVTTTVDQLAPSGGGCSLREAIDAVDSPGSANGDCAPARSVPTRSCSGRRPTR